MSALGNRTLTDEQVLLRRQFVAFFEDDAFRDKYDTKLRDMMDAGKNRLIVDVGDLIDFQLDDGGTLGHGVVRDPGVFVPLCELAVADLVARRQPEFLKVDYRTKPVHVGFEGPVGEVLGPRDIYARHLNSMVAVEGIITRQSPLRPRVLETVHYCHETNKFSRKEYRDQLSPMLDAAHLPTVNVMPRTDMEGHLLRTELGLCSFMDSQCAVLQEAPEAAPTGQLPRQVEVRFDDDLVDSIKPGDRVVVVGLYCAYTTADAAKSFKTIILCNHVYHQAQAVKVPKLLDRHADAIRRFCAVQQHQHGATGVLDVLSRSIAPSIYGLTNEKKAVLLMMIGGIERKAHNSHVRGDINVLLVGEPSTAKSQLLRYVLNVVPLALSTTGKGSSGVGLTAAVAVDSYTGERTLSAGAMVLADRGVLCVDEFDKMSPQDRVAMHEAMEQQTVTIAKAGIHASLNARCSVLAAANPVYGFYSVKHKLAFNVGLPESLLSRFDLTFIILDQHASEHNRRVGTHILHNHVHATPAAFNAAPTRTVVGRDDVQDENLGPHGAQQVTHDESSDLVNSEGDHIVGIGFLRRYIRHCQTVEPMLTDMAQALISQHYVQLRGEQGDNNGMGKDGFIVTARTLESMIRLATAHAKLRLSSAITEADVEVAMGLLRASVHAGADASAVRRDERKTTREQTEMDAAAANLPTLARDGRDARAHRPEAPVAAVAAADDTAVPATGTSSSSASAPVVDPTFARAVTDVLRTFQREQRTEVSLHAVAERMGAVDVAQLHAALSALDSADFTFASSDTEDVVYFV